jgi:hypothetical protein
MDPTNFDALARGNDYGMGWNVRWTLRGFAGPVCNRWKDGCEE